MDGTEREKCGDDRTGKEEPLNLGGGRDVPPPFRVFFKKKGNAIVLPK